MKKYFVTETDEPIEFGDVISLQFIKKTEDGKVTVDKEVELSEDTLDMLLSLGVVEEEEVDREDDLIEFEDSEHEACPILSCVIEDVANLQDRMDLLEDRIAKLEGNKSKQKKNE